MRSITSMPSMTGISELKQCHFHLFGHSFIEQELSGPTSTSTRTTTPSSPLAMAIALFLVATDRCGTRRTE
jgi:hypothetical protein